MSKAACWVNRRPPTHQALRGFAVDSKGSHNQGSGKTLLAKIIAILHGGVQRGELPRDADELRKSITAALIDTTAPVVTFDNLTGVIRSSVLESLLTSRTWTDRLLGQNRSVTATNDRLWLATGNNAAFGGDLARRNATVALDPPEANHHLRDNFKIKELEVWAEQCRGDLLAAILTVARGWVVAGRPSETARSDSYAPQTPGLQGAPPGQLKPPKHRKPRNRPLPVLRQTALARRQLLWLQVSVTAAGTPEADDWIDRLFSGKPSPLQATSRSGHEALAPPPTVPWSG
jgi:hypothetical protein